MAAITKPTGLIKDDNDTLFDNDSNVNEQVEAHVSGAADRHEASDIDYSGSLSALTVHGALEDMNDRVQNIINGLDLDPNKDPEVLDAREDAFGVIHQDLGTHLHSLVEIDDLDNAKVYRHYTKFENGHIVDVYEEVL